MVGLIHLQVGEGETILRSSQHAGVHKLLPRHGPGESHLGPLGMLGADDRMGTRQVDRYIDNHRQIDGWIDK